MVVWTSPSRSVGDVIEDLERSKASLTAKLTCAYQEIEGLNIHISNLAIRLRDLGEKFSKKTAHYTANKGKAKELLGALRRSRDEARGRVTSLNLVLGAVFEDADLLLSFAKAYWARVRALEVLEHVKGMSGVSRAERMVDAKAGVTETTVALNRIEAVIRERLGTQINSLRDIHFADVVETSASVEGLSD